MKLTAVEWLEEELAANLKTIVLNNDHRLIEDIFAKAKVMEKEQLFEFWTGGINCTEENGKDFEQYYNETYTR